MHLTIDQVAKRLKVHRNTVYRMRKDGRLEGGKTSTFPQGRVLVTEASVRALEKRKAAETGAKG